MGSHGCWPYTDQLHQSGREPEVKYIASFRKESEQWPLHLKPQWELRKGQSIIPRMENGPGFSVHVLALLGQPSRDFQSALVSSLLTTNENPGTKWHFLRPSKGIILILGSREAASLPNLS